MCFSEVPNYTAWSWEIYMWPLLAIILRRYFIASYCKYYLYKTFNPLCTPGEQVPQTMCRPESPQVNDTRISIKHFPVDILRWRWRDSLVFLLLAVLPSFISRRGPEISLLAFHCCMLCRALFMLLSLLSLCFFLFLVTVILIGTYVPFSSSDLFCIHLWLFW